MPPVVRLDWWRQKHAERLRFEDEQRQETIESLNPTAMSMNNRLLVLRYKAGKETPVDLFKRILSNPAWALNLFSAVQRVMFGRSVIRVLKVQSVRIVGEGANQYVEVAFKANMVRGRGSIKWRVLKPAERSFEKNLLSYEFI